MRNRLNRCTDETCEYAKMNNCCCRRLFFFHLLWINTSKHGEIFSFRPKTQDETVNHWDVWKFLFFSSSLCTINHSWKLAFRCNFKLKCIIGFSNLRARDCVFGQTLAMSSICKRSIDEFIILLKDIVSEWMKGKKEISHYLHVLRMAKICNANCH